MEQLTIGCDLGDRWTQICVLAGRGESIEEARVRTTPAGFRRYFSKRPTARVVIEVGTHSPWVADLLAELEHDVVVANPRVVRLIATSTTDSTRRPWLGWGASTRISCLPFSIGEGNPVPTWH